MKDRERNAGVEKEDSGQTRKWIHENRDIYVKAASDGYMPIIYHNPHMHGITDDKRYIRNKMTGEYNSIN